jgi:hypothetical protein
MVKRRNLKFKKLEVLEARLPVTKPVLRISPRSISKPEAGKSKFVFSNFELLLPSLDNERPENDDFKEV